MDFQLNAYNMAVSSEVVGDIQSPYTQHGDSSTHQSTTTLPLTLQHVD